MKHVMSLQRFSFEKILNGSKKIDVRLFDEKRQMIRPNDLIEFVCRELDERLMCVVKAFLVFDTADNMVDVLPPSLFGYDNREEIRVRLRRLFPKEAQLKYGVMGIIIECLDRGGAGRYREGNGIEDEVNVPVGRQSSRVKEGTAEKARVRQMIEQEEFFNQGRE